MAIQPIIVTEYDVKEPNLLLRFLRKVADGLLKLSGRIDKLETAYAPPGITTIRQALEATGTHPLHLGNLIGETSDPQPAKVTHYTTAPAGLALQRLRDSQLVTVGSTSTGDALYRVIGGNPNTLRSISPTVGIGSVITVKDADFTVTGDVDTTKHTQLEVDALVTAGATRLMTIPDTDQILAGRNVNNSFSALQTFSTGINLTGGQFTSTSQYSAMVLLTTNQSITTATDTPVNWSAASHDQGTLFTAADRLTAPTSGIYMIGGAVVFSTSTSGTYRRAYIYVDAVAVYGFDSRPPDAVSQVYMTVPPTVLSLTTGNYIQIICRHDATGSLLIGNNTFPNFMYMHRIC